MTYAASVGVSPEPEGPAGYSYAVVLLSDAGSSAPEVLARLRELRFSGWVAPPRDGWLAVVPERTGTVAAGRRDVVGVAEALASTTAGGVLALRVLDDRQLVLVAWAAGREVLRYVSDPSREPGVDPDVAPDPYGVEEAGALAGLCGRPDVAEELEALLEEPLDDETEIESERLGRVLGLLGLPTWVVNAWRLPRSVHAGPSRKDLVRLGAGRSGLLGVVAGRVVRVLRRSPPPVLADAPAGPDPDDPALWM